MRFLYLLPVFVSLVTSKHPYSRTGLQSLLESNTVREKVPGNNPAYYTREQETDQLFDITEFIVTPSPPLSYTNRRVFFYLNGAVIHDYPGLSNSTLSLHARFPSQPDLPRFQYTDQISDFKLVTVRHEGVYGGPLVVGGNELVGDQELSHFGQEPETQEIDVEVVAKLPDHRILFAFEAKMNVTL